MTLTLKVKLLAVQLLQSPSKLRIIVEFWAAILHDEQDKFTTCFETCGAGPLFWGVEGGYNGMLRHSLGRAVIFISLHYFIAPGLVLMPYLQARGTRDCN